MDTSTQLKFNEGNVEYVWKGLLSELFYSREKHITEGTVRYIHGRLYYASNGYNYNEIGRLIQIVNWKLCVPKIAADPDTVKKEIFF